MKEFRRWPRYKVRQPVTLVRASGELEGLSENLSVDGMSVRVRADLQLGDCVKLRVGLPGDVEIETLGEIIWAEYDDDRYWYYGLRHARMSEADRLVYEQFLSDIELRQAMGQVRETPVSSFRIRNVA